MERLASGHRINRASDDAAGLAITENMRSKIRGYSQARQNANDASTMMQVAEGAMGEMSNILVRLRELTVQSSSDTVADRDRAYLNEEYVNLTGELDRIAGSTEFNGNKFFTPDGKDQYIIQVGINNTDPEENVDTLSINLDGLKFSSQDFGLGKGAEIGPKNSGSFSPSREQIAKNLSKIDTSINKVNNERAKIGAMQSRVGSTINNLSVSIENLSSSKSQIKDVDVATESANLARNKILTQSNISVLAQANQMPELALSLLR